MKSFFLVFLCTLVMPNMVLGQITATPEFILIGRDQLPMNGEVIKDTFLFFDHRTGAFRGGILFATQDWATDSLGTSSFSYGFDTRATGSKGAIAVGRGSRASGDIGATAFGDQTRASGDYGATALGSLTRATGRAGATALGYNTKAYGEFGSIAIGFGGLSYGDYGSSAYGYNTTSTGNHCSVFGMFNDTMVARKTLVASESPLFIIGNGNGWAGNESNAMVVLKDGRLGVGENIDYSSLYSPSVKGVFEGSNFPTLAVKSTDATDPKMQLTYQPVDSESDWTMRMDVSDDEELEWRFNNASRLHLSTEGKMVIGNKNVQRGDLNIYSGLGNANMYIEADNSNMGFNFGVTQGTSGITNPELYIAHYDGTTYSDRLVIREDGAIQVNILGSAGSTQLCHNAASEISSCSSSKRYKKEINPYLEGYRVLDQLRPVSYRWKIDNKADIGFIAEEIAAIDERFITRDNLDRIEGVKYDRMIAVLVNVAKEQQKEIEMLKEQLAQLKNISEVSRN